MKVIIELTENVSLENNECTDEVTICFNSRQENKSIQAISCRYTVNIDNLRLALRKLAAK